MILFEKKIEQKLGLKFEMICFCYDCLDDIQWDLLFHFASIVQLFSSVSFNPQFHYLSTSGEIKHFLI